MHHLFMAEFYFGYAQDSTREDEAAWVRLQPPKGADTNLSAYLQTRTF